MRFVKLISCMFGVLFLSGCVSQKAMDIPVNFWETGGEKNIAIAFVQPPEMNAHRMGGQGLLDMAINEIVTDSVESHIHTLSHDKFELSKSAIAQQIERRGGRSEVLPEYYKASDATKLPKAQQKDGFFGYDLTELQEQYSASHLLVIQVLASGTIRDYYGFIPLSQPRGYVYAQVKLVDLSNNKIVMDHQINEQVALPENVDWDDPDNGYPEITKVVHLALEQAGKRLTQYL
ncbi:cytidine deaminase [Vibrio coralliilyticus]|uniref:cytidine deaminase n=2 Tax=Vibrio coralliilyticus TaxID=190893 RepID=UPI00155FA72F|nr:cytidine deaminase [Vibrio coralliilyticus]NRF30269.1 cytidine deaminase [Vibrio coralliilyticus]NRF52755.1 cytidine deaminase [Vibrio coralliilyticus]NRG04363.1 cytidine deaminase [Vibrio coralliilyticus]